VAASRAVELVGAAPASASRRLLRRARVRGRVGFRQADRATFGLAAFTAATAGVVVVGEFARRLRRRVAREHPEAVELAEHPIEALQIAGRATQDTVRVAVEGYTSASRAETVLFNLFTGFAGAFVVARISTSGIASGWWPLGNVEIGGRHIHHFVPGILIAFASAMAAMLVDDDDVEAALALPFGVGVGLTFDEAALLLDLRDVYWTREGLLSVQLSLGGIALLGGTIVALRMARRGEERGEEQGLIPDAEGEMAGPEMLAPSPVA
jgi:hypothetical protein